jgi:hypothetical protein
MRSTKNLVIGVSLLATVSAPAVAFGAVPLGVRDVAQQAALKPDNAIAAKLHRVEHRSLVRETVALARSAADLDGHQLRKGYGQVITTWSDQRLLRKQASLTSRIARMRSQGYGIAIPAVLQSIAACESGGNPRAVGGGGAYRGKYQFDYGTWASVGGSGDPAAAPEAEQDRRAAMLYSRSGATPWPICGR